MCSTFIIIAVICAFGLAYLALIHFCWLRESTHADMPVQSSCRE